MANLRAYGTLAQLRARQGLATADGVADDSRLLAKLRSATGEIERFCIRTFQPLYEARTFDWQTSDSLNFRGQDLLELVSVVDGQNVTVPTNGIILRGGTGSAASSKNGPFYGMEVDPTVGFLSYISTPKRTITVTGWWGWHDDWRDSAWHDSSVTVSGAYTALDTILTTTTNSGSDAWGQSPALSAGQLVKIGAELMQLVKVVSATQIQVTRGASGTTAGAISASAAIQVYESPRDINEACVRWAAYLFAQDSADFTKTVFPGVGGVSVPTGVPKDIFDMLRPYQKLRVA